MRITSILAIIVFAFSFVLHAREEKLLQTLTLEQAIATAKSKNWDMVAVEARFRQAQSISLKALSSYLPKVSAVGNYTRNTVEAKIDVPISITETREFIITPLDQFGVTAQLTQTLISPWLISQLANLKKIGVSNRFTREHAKREILFGVAQLYYGVVSSQEVVVAQKRLLEGRVAHAKDVALRFAQGYLTKVDLLRAEIDTAGNEQDLALAENGFSAAKLALATMLARDPDFEVVKPIDRKRPAEQDFATENFEKRRLDLRSAKLSEELAMSVKSTGYLRYLPELGFFAQYRGSNVEGFAGNKHTGAFGLNLSWNILDGGFREAELYENSAKALEAKAGVRSLQLRIREEKERAKLDLNSAEANKQKAEKQVELARENFRLVNVSYNAGVATYLEFTDASDKLASAEISLVGQTLAINLAALKLQRALGIFE